MKLLSLILVFASTLSAACAEANNWYDRGNAGFVLACAGKKPVVLDLHENSTRQLGKIQFSSATTVTAKALDIISRLDSYDGGRAAQYKSWALSFFNEAQWIHDAAFNQTPDLGMVIIPNDCRLEQVIFQRNPSVLNKTRYMIDENLWSQLDSDNQAALIVHEIIYREFMNSVTKELASERIRIFNLVAHTNALQGLTLPEYIALLQELHFTSYISQNLKFTIGFASYDKGWLNLPLTLNADGNVIKGTLAAQQTFIRKHISYSCNTTELAALGLVKLDDNGTLRTLNVQDDFDTHLCGLPFTTIPGDDGPITISGTVWSFDENEQPLYISGVPDRAHHSFTYKGTTYEVQTSALQQEAYSATYYFDSALNLTALDLGGNACRNEKTRHVVFSRTTSPASALVLSLDTQGNLKSSIPSCY
ncbi:hypothetical protein EZJ49_06420 [Bdellovibrio bacteriovorus]|uniref:hypothetical protein n=1 Tax=Bdellovibrio bacteriovorus TaxID=959 RepID=UPI0021D382D6|nr:hypothetical protein [Bdellovibrio bacteriovorus]UXR65881.1 hypothetical protein EZJ49_06420 [Bdellovibrio bacteriovorus]